MTSFQVHISFWIIIVFWETAPYPSPKPTLTLNSHLRQNVGLGEGGGGSFPETYNDPISLYDVWILLGEN